VGKPHQTLADAHSNADPHAYSGPDINARPLAAAFPDCDAGDKLG
jgi:hypothetical protein